MSQQMYTTNLRITLPSNFNHLEEQFNLYRYEIPAIMSLPQNKSKYNQLHNQLKEQIDHPYKAYKYDKMDGVKKWVVYVLYPKQEEPKPITIKFLSDNRLVCRQIGFGDLEVFNLIKLLQVSYFRRLERGQFVGQDKCYILAKRQNDKFNTCLEIELKGSVTEDSESTYIIKVVGHARFFRLETEPLQADYEKRFTYYAQIEVKKGQMYFSQIKPSQVLKYPHPLYKVWSSKEHPATLDYHSQSDTEHTRGKVLHDFITGFTSYLQEEFNILAELQKREFHRFEPSKKPEGLPLEKMGTIYLYDNRRNKEQHPIEAYQQLFARHTSVIEFKIISELSDNFPHKVLVIQDYEETAFEAGLLDGEDPYKVLYREYPSVLKKSFNVNLNDSRKTGSDSYLNYSLINLATKGIKEKISVTLDRFFLKELVMRQADLQEYTLPLAPVNYIFLQKTTHKGNSYEVMLSFQNNRLVFVDLATPEGKDSRQELAVSYGLDWDDLYDQMLNRNKPNRTAGEELSSYDIILGPGQFIEIEKLWESVLYNYGEIIARQKARTRTYPVEELKLARHYDKIRTAKMLSLAELQAKGFLSDQAQPNNDSEEASLARYQQLVAFDEILEQRSAAIEPELSMDDLAKGELLEQIAAIFSITPEGDGKINQKKFKGKLFRYYQRVGMFPSPKKSDLHLYEGIWYTADNSYLVGSSDSLKDKQAKASLLRRFYLYTGEDSFRIDDLLDATSVKFIRLNQYTVLPYYFSLIQIYIRDVLNKY